MRKAASGLAIASVLGLFVWSMSLVVRSNDAPAPEVSSAQESSSVVTEATVTDKCSAICTSSTGCNRACLDNTGKQITCGQWGTCFLCSKCTSTINCEKPCLKAGKVTTCRLATGGVCGGVDPPCTATTAGFDASADGVGPGFPITFTPQTALCKPGSDVNWDWGDTQHQFSPADAPVDHSWAQAGDYIVVMGSTNLCNQSVLSGPLTIHVISGGGIGGTGKKQRN